MSTAISAWGNGPWTRVWRYWDLAATLNERDDGSIQALNACNITPECMDKRALFEFLQISPLTTVFAFSAGAGLLKFWTFSAFMGFLWWFGSLPENLLLLNLLISQDVWKQKGGEGASYEVFELYYSCGLSTTVPSHLSLEKNPKKFYFYPISQPFQPI